MFPGYFCLFRILSLFALPPIERHVYSRWPSRSCYCSFSLLSYLLILLSTSSYLSLSKPKLHFIISESQNHFKWLFLSRDMPRLLTRKLSQGDRKYRLFFLLPKSGLFYFNSINYTKLLVERIFNCNL